MSGAAQVGRKTGKYAACQAKMQTAKQAEGTSKNGITGNQANREACRQAGRQTEMATILYIQLERKTDLRRLEIDR
jgi:hypothetical protein